MYKVPPTLDALRRLFSVDNFLFFRYAVSVVSRSEKVIKDKLVTADILYWIGFSKVPGIGPARFKKLLEYFGSVEDAWRADPGELAAVGLDKRAVSSLTALRPRINLSLEWQALQTKGITTLTWDDETYPRQLKNIVNPPFVLYVRGSILPRDEWALAVVGTRNASVYGKEVTRTLVEGLAASGVTIVSGLALGIDTQAHASTVAVGGRTLAVLGCGPDTVYPRRNEKLAADIVQHGALVSEFPLGTPPESGNFPRRNRIISGLSMGVLMVEGSVKSGARITVDFALEQGRDVFAVPGNILGRGSAGPNKLIQQGAKLVTTIGDILEELNLKMVAQHTEARKIIPDTPVEAAILPHLSAEPLHVDELGRLTGLTSAELSSALTMMELKGMVRPTGGMSYIIASKTQLTFL